MGDAIGGHGEADLARASQVDQQGGQLDARGRERLRYEGNSAKRYTYPTSTSKLNSPLCAPSVPVGDPEPRCPREADVSNPIGVMVRVTTSS